MSDRPSKPGSRLSRRSSREPATLDLTAEPVVEKPMADETPASTVSDQPASAPEQATPDPLAETPLSPPPSTPAAPIPESFTPDPEASREDATGRDGAQRRDPFESRPSPDPEPAPPARQNGSGRLFLPALVGGAIGAGAMAAGLVATGFLQAPAAPPSSTGLAVPSDLAALPGRVDRLETAIREGAASRLQTDLPSGDLAAIRAQIESLTGRLGQIEGRPAPAAPDLAPLASAIRAAEGAARDARERAEAAGTRAATAETLAREAQAAARDLQPAAREMPALSSRLAALEQASRTANPGAAAAARLVIARRIADAVAEGQEAGADLATLARLGVATDNLAARWPALRQTGSNAALRTGFAPLAEAARRAEERTQQPAATGWGERLLGWAGGLVRIRRTDAPVSALTQRLADIDAALAAGRMSEALAAWNALQETARTGTAAARWTEALTARVQTDAALLRIADEALAALAAPAR